MDLSFCLLDLQGFNSKQGKWFQEVLWGKVPHMHLESLRSVSPGFFFVFFCCVCVFNEQGLACFRWEFLCSLNPSYLLQRSTPVHLLFSLIALIICSRTWGEDIHTDGKAHFPPTCKRKGLILSPFSPGNICPGYIPNQQLCKYIFTKWKQPYMNEEANGFKCRHRSHYRNDSCTQVSLNQKVGQPQESMMCVCVCVYKYI